MTRPLVEHHCWQCSRCSGVFFTRWRQVCPACCAVDYWCGSVVPADRERARRVLEAEDGR